MVGFLMVRRTKEFIYLNWLKYVKLDKTLPDPNIATEGSFGIDFYSSEDLTLLPLESGSVGLGVKVEIPKGHVGILKTRSGQAFKSSVDGHVGYIDSDYRGELRVQLHNQDTDYTYHVEKGDKIAQMGIIKAPKIILKQVDKLSETQRGEGGFGSTGV